MWGGHDLGSKFNKTSLVDRSDIHALIMCPFPAHFFFLAIHQIYKITTTVQPVSAALWNNFAKKEMPYSLPDLYIAIQDTVVNKLQHEHYERTVKLAKKYKTLITGEGFEELLHQFVRREDLDLFKQRQRITQPITPAICAAIMNPFYKVGRTNNIAKKIDFSESSSDKATRIFDAIEGFWGEKSLDKYLETRFTELSFSDPNAFIVTEFDEAPDVNGAMSQVPKPRAFEVPSENVINFFYKNNALEWLIVRLPIAVVSGTGIVQGWTYTIYGPEYSLKFSQVSLDEYSGTVIGQYSTLSVLVDNIQQQLTLFRANEKELYIVEEFNHKSKTVPAIRVGYKSDLVTDGATCVNPFHDGMAYLMKSVKTVSEFDLTMALHTFPQKFAYGPRCMGKSETITCVGGMTPDGTVCGRCHGTGVAIHSTAQDAVILRMPPKDEDMQDLSKLVYYAHPPIDLVKFQNEYILQLKNEVKHAVFNSEIFSQTEVAATATEKKISLESVYDTLFPYAQKFSDVYKQIAKTSAYYVDITDAIIIHQFPKDFKFKTVSELLAELKLANDSNAPGYVRKELSNDIAEAQFIDKPDELAKIRIKSKFYPFSDKTDVEILYIISNNKTTKENTILWANFDNIFTDIEEDENIGPNFYMMTHAKQKEIVTSKVQALIELIGTQEPAVALPFGQTEE
jgi:hypothetical protein